MLASRPFAALLTATLVVTAACASTGTSSPATGAPTTVPDLSATLGFPNIGPAVVGLPTP